MKRLNLTYLTLMLAVFGCGSNKAMQAPSVTHYGVLREIMMEQKLEARIDLQTLQDKRHLYGLGALEGLAGEIMIMDGISHVSLADSSGVQLEQGFDKQAALLVISQVEEWKEFSLNITWHGLENVQTMIAEVARQEGLDTGEAFPFMLKGEFDELSWHVINGPNAKAPNHDAYREAGASGIEKETKGRVLGFYSEKHEGVFTHHGSYLHMHFINNDQTLMGHVDDLQINGKIMLYIPKTEGS